MGQPVEIPLIASPQDFTTTLNGVAYSLRVRWNVAAAYWTLDIGTGNNAPIASGIPLLCGQDLLGQYGYLGLAGQLWVVNDAHPGIAPGFSDLGNGAHLVFVPT